MVFGLSVALFSHFNIVAQSARRSENMAARHLFRVGLLRLSSCDWSVMRASERIVLHWSAHFVVRARKPLSLVMVFGPVVSSCVPGMLVCPPPVLFACGRSGEWHTGALQGLCDWP
jgi:hypothetical protein